MSRRRILIVDDQAETCRIVRLALQDSDFAFFEAATGELAMRVARVAHPDLVVLSRQLPGRMDGLQVLQALRADAAHAHALVILLTGKREALDRQAAAQAGVNQILAKPLAPASLRQLVDAMLRATPPPGLQ